MSRPSNLPDWATNANYGAGARPWNGQPNKTAPSGGVIAEGFDPENPLYADFFNWLLNNHGQWAGYHDSVISASVFGNGADGSYVLDGAQAAVAGLFSKSGSTYTLLRDTAFTNLTVTGAGVVLKTGNCRLRGKGTLTTAAGGKINQDGPAAVGGTQGSAYAATSVGGGTGGGAGVTNSNVGNSGSNITNSVGGAGGLGGFGGGFAPGNGGTATAPAGNLGDLNVLSPATVGYIFSWASTGAWTQVQGGTGGGSGGCNAGSGTSGAGGAGGGICVVLFRSISLANATDISCNGGAGGNATAGTSTSVGGGGGGGGGALFIAYFTSNQTFTAAVNCAGGAFGTATGTGNPGVVGSNGNLYLFNLGG